MSSLIRMLLQIILYYSFTYIFAYFILELSKWGLQKYSKEEYEKIGKDVWIRYYCVLVVLWIHFIWIHCHFNSSKNILKICFHSIHKHSNLEYFIFPILFLTPIYIIFFYHYYDYQWGESSTQENEKLNRILARIMILLFLVTIVFLFLSQKYQKKTMDVVTVLSVFELF